MNKLARCVTAVSSLAFITACGMVPVSGPSSHSIQNVKGIKGESGDVLVVDADEDLARRLTALDTAKPFSDIFGEGLATDTVVGIGDTLDIAIWEAPPATLFSSGGSDPRSAGSGGSASRGTMLPEQMVDSAGEIIVPFAGHIKAVGKTPHQIETEINSRLAGKAHQPQALVRMVHITNAVVTIVGDVAANTRSSLTPKGERILDVLAGAGGARQPVGKTTVRLTRDNQVASMPMEAILRDPRQNIRLKPNDVITLLFQPNSFTALGASGRNEEIPFEATGLKLSQALGRIAGLQDARADAKGVFIFRFEDPAALRPDQVAGKHLTPEGKIPTIYRVNLRDPQTLFLAQNFPIRDKDILYVSNAPLADIQKFINVIYSSILPIATVVTVAP